MERQATSGWAPAAPRMRPIGPDSSRPQPLLPHRVLAASILIAMLTALGIKLLPVEWSHVLTALVITGSNLPL